jgi:hypothetical protein
VWAELACFQENKHLATRKHDTLGFDQLIEIGCTFHSILLPRAFHFMIMAHFPRTPQQISLPAGLSKASRGMTYDKGHRFSACSYHVISNSKLPLL